MAYASQFHVETYTPGRAPYDGNTKPSASMVLQLLAEATADIEGELVRAGYAIPIPASATVAFQIVQSACAKCAAAAIEETAPTSDDNTRKRLLAMCENAKKMIRAGELPGLDKDDDQSRPRDGFSATPFFTRDMAL